MTHHAEVCPAGFRDAYVRILEALCASAPFQARAGAVLKEVSQAVDCGAVALRLRDERGDYPYFVHEGFDEGFARGESSLLRRGAGGRVERCADGRPALACLCGAVIRGETSAALSCFTAGGSFWTNAASEPAAGGAAGKGARRGACAERYESAALVPVRAEAEIVGLLQLNDRRTGRFRPEVLGFLELVGRRLGEAVRTAWRLEELGRAQRDLEEQRQGRENMIAVGEMASCLAHDLKNPLADMSLSVGRLQRALRGDEKLAPMADHLGATIQTLSETITRITGAVGNPQLRLGAVHVERVLDEAVRMVAPRAEAQGVQVFREPADDLPAVNGDAHFLKCAFINLLENALDAMPSAGRLRLESRSVPGGEVEVLIADSGPGIDPARAEKLFQPFQAAAELGAGMGLSLARRMLELQSGNVILRPGADGGTEALVKIPAGGRAGPRRTGGA